MNSSHIREVHVVFKTHLDVGYTDLASNVVEEYITSFIPKALAMAKRIRERGSSERFIWTTGAWLIDQYLARTVASEHALMERGIEQGDIAWHALPFTLHSEMMDADHFRAGLAIARDLDKRYGRRTIAAKMTDVPGHTRGIIPILVEAGVEFLHIGVNGGCIPPDVPSLFRWRSTKGAEITVAYANDYGGVLVVPEISAALWVEHTRDNTSPPAFHEIIHTFLRARHRFPNAHITASTLDTFATRLAPIRDQLPVVIEEIGDTWIHGLGTDPLKVSQYRALCRLRSGWIAQDRIASDDPLLNRFHHALLLIPEHTWGLDEKLHLGDTTHYIASKLKMVREQPFFQHFASSWNEQRHYIHDAIATLEDTSFAEEARIELAALTPRRPETTEFAPIADVEQLIQTEHFILGFDSATGAITTLIHHATGRIWATPQHPLAVLRYEVFGQLDYDRFLNSYLHDWAAREWWANEDFGKRGLDKVGVAHQAFVPILQKIWQAQRHNGYAFVLELVAPPATYEYGCPQAFTVELFCPNASSELQITLQWFNKPASRIPEALWFSFNPDTSEPHGWRLDKLSEFVDPLDVVRHGNRTLHAVGNGFSYMDTQGVFALQTLDAPLVAPGAPALLQFSDTQPNLTGGMHINLYNNVWGTNFPMWYDEDARFRFVTRFLTA